LRPPRMTSAAEGIGGAAALHQIGGKAITCVIVSMSLDLSIVQLPDFVVEEISFKQPIVIRVVTPGRSVARLRASELRLKDSWMRRVRHQPDRRQADGAGVADGQVCVPVRSVFPYLVIRAFCRTRVERIVREHVGKKHEASCPVEFSVHDGDGLGDRRAHYRHFLGRKAAEVEGNSARAVLASTSTSSRRSRDFDDAGQPRDAQGARRRPGRSEASLGPYLEKWPNWVRTKVVPWTFGDYRSIVRATSTRRSSSPIASTSFRLINHHFMRRGRDRPSDARAVPHLADRRHQENPTRAVPKLQTYLADYPCSKPLTLQADLCELIAPQEAQSSAARERSRLPLRIECLKDTPIPTFRRSRHAGVLEGRDSTDVALHKTTRSRGSTTR